MKDSRKRVVFAALAALLVLTAAACARNKPAEFPDQHSWQKRTAPLALFGGQAGVIASISAYPYETPDLPEGVAEQFRRDDYRVPSRLDVICSDQHGEGDAGRIAIVLSVSQPVLSVWHPTTWESWSLEFSNSLNSVSKKDTVVVDIRDDSGMLPLALERGYIPFVNEAAKTDSVRGLFKKYAGEEGAELKVTAVFPAGENKPSLEWTFDIGKNTNAFNYVKDISERCGEVW